MMKDRQLSNTLKSIFRKLYAAFGPQLWWPGDTPFEVIVGAILTQNTSWKNVEKAIQNLNRVRLLNPKRLHSLSEQEIARLIRPAGYYNIKAKRLKHFLNYLFKHYGGSINAMFQKGTDALRRELLLVNGIGPETADSILLYAGNHPVFVVDAYTKRIFSRHRMIESDADYHDVQEIFMKNLPRKVNLFNEYHALIVKTGKDFCKTRKPRCHACPLMQ